MATVADLGRQVKAKYPGAYDDMDDAALGQSVKAKYPGSYDDFSDEAAPEPPGLGEAISTGIQRGGYALTGLVGLDRAKAVSALDWLDRKLGLSEAPEKPRAEIEAEMRKREGALEREHPLGTGVGIGVGAMPAALIAPQAAPAAGASLAARSGAGALTAGAQSAAIEAGVTADLPLGERLKRVGAAGLMGAGLGALAPGAAPTVSGATLPKLPSPVADFLARRAEGAAVRSTGADRTALKRVLLREGGEERAAKVGRFMLDEPEMRLRSPGTIAEDAAEILAKEGPEIGALTAKADAAGALFDAAAFAARAKQKVVAPLASNPMQKVPGHHGGLVNPAAERLTGFLDDVVSRAKNGGISASEAHAVRQQMDEFLRGVRGAQDPESTVLKSAVNDIRRILNDELGKAMDRGGLGDEWATANQRFSRASDVSKLAEVGVERRSGNAFLTPTEKGGGLVGATMAAMGEPASGAALVAGTVVAKRYGAPMAARTLDRLSQLLRSNPQSLGARGSVLAKIEAERGPEALAAAHYVLAHIDRDYAARAAQVLDEGEDKLAASESRP